LIATQEQHLSKLTRRSIAPVWSRLASAFFVLPLALACGGNDATNPNNPPPVVTAHFPELGEQGVFVDVFVEVHFNEAMDPNTINTSTFTVTGPVGPMPVAGAPAANGPIPGIVTYLNNNVATFTPLTPGLHEFVSEYTVVLNGMRDAGGAQMATKTWSFSTALFDPAYEYRMWNYQDGPNWILGTGTIAAPFGCGMRNVQAGTLPPNDSRWHFTLTGNGRFSYRMNNAFASDFLSLYVGPVSPTSDRSCYLETTQPLASRQWWRFDYQGDQKYTIVHEGNPTHSLGALSTSDGGIIPTASNFPSQSWTFVSIGRR
jgi:hypothetical protein